MFFDVKDFHAGKVSPRTRCQCIHRLDLFLLNDGLKMDYIQTIYLQIIHLLVSLLYHSIQRALDPCILHSTVPPALVTARYG